MPRGMRRFVVLCLLIGGTACGLGGTQSGVENPTPAHGQTRNASTPTPAPTPPLPPYFIESLRARAYPGGSLQIGQPMFRGAGFSKYHMSWPSGGQTMTGTISLPDGAGPFPAVVVNHGFIPPERYWIGQDSGIFGDPMASHGFIAVAPNWPGYSGSGPGAPGLPPIVQETVETLDLVSSLASLPQADMARVALVGHSNGGGISEIAMVVDPRIRAVVLHGPVSSDMADNARKWWMSSPTGAGPVGSPDANPDGYAHLSPRNYFAASNPPTLMIQGTSDQDIPAAWTEATLAALQAKGIESKVTWYPGAMHDFAGANLSSAVREQENWIRHALGMPALPGA